MWKDQWIDGIVDWSFTKEDILNEFTKRNIEIPDSLMSDFENTLLKKKKIRNLNYLNSIKKEPQN